MSARAARVPVVRQAGSCSWEVYWDKGYRCCHRGHNGSSGTHLGNRKQTIQVRVTRLKKSCTQIPQKGILLFNI